MVATAARSRAATVAEALLKDEGTRLAHSAAVARQVERVVGLLPERWLGAAIDAAWLHDIGYSSYLAYTGFHPLDGARWLRDHGWANGTCRLVAWHTGAIWEARLDGLAGQLAADFARPQDLPLAALTWADLTSTPSGERCDAEWRLAEILNRYPPGSIVHQATLASLPTLRSAVRRIEAALAAPRRVRAYPR